MEDEWSTGEKKSSGGKVAVHDFDEKYWGIEDMHGHRFQAQLTDGKDRWMLPLSRKQFEELFAAVCEENPWVGDVFRTPSNFLRQYVGNMMQWMVENGVEKPPAEVRRLQILMKAQQFEYVKDNLRQMKATLADPALPKGLRHAAGDELLAVDEDVLEAGVGLTYEAVRDAISHLTHDG